MLETDATTMRDSAAASRTGVYGVPDAKLVNVPADAVQFSPLMPGASELETQEEGALTSIAMAAPSGALERRYAMALALRAVAQGGSFAAHAPNDRGGTRLRKELQAFGCTVDETARRHHRIVVCTRPDNLTGIDEALANGGPRVVKDLDLWSQPGVFSWDRIDPGTALLMDQLQPLSGRGVDFGCGIGVLSRAVLASKKVKQLTSIDIDRRAIKAAQRNFDEPRLRFLWADVREKSSDLIDLDFVVMNAPFHDAGAEDRALALDFVLRAAEVLHKGGVCWLTANRHLPYEAVLNESFKRVELKTQTSGYKIYEAHK